MKKQRFLLVFGLALAAVSFFGCGNDPKPEAAESAGEADTASAAVPREITLSPFPASPEFPDANISLDYRDGKFLFRVGGGYQLGQQTGDAAQKSCANAEKGQHIQLVVDNQSFDVLHTPVLDKQLPDGEHVMLAFLCRSYFEGIKSPTAFTAIKGEVKANTLGRSVALTEPMLFYSRPIGTYTGKAETAKVMLDFYLTNVTLSPDGYKVKILVNNEKEFVVDKWQPYFLEGLPLGDNKVKLTLIDKDGRDVAAPLNPVENVFTLLE